MENKLERWKMRTKFPAIVSPCPTVIFSERLNIRTLHPPKASEFPKTSRGGDILMRWLGVKINPGTFCLILILIKHWSL